MTFNSEQLWDRFKKYYSGFPALALSLDLSRMKFADDYFDKMEPPMQKAFAAMAELEKGALANPDEKRMVGHYWLRNPALAPTASIRKEIEDTIGNIKIFTKEVHEGIVQGERGPFKNILLIGIGGSALGPQFVAHALSHPTTDKMEIYFFDNTDPDGMDKVLSKIITELGQTLCIVISKSGGTKETRNGMLEAQTAYERAGLDFGRHAVAITGSKSGLENVALNNHWLKIFPMWDWVGGRTSETSAVGLLPASLQGFDIEGILSGARACDEATRVNNVKVNPAAQLALAWHHAGNGKGEKDMVVLPYKDRLELFSRYLQQLIMESLGKERDLDGNVVNQGIAVYGNKGSTDQHAYVQQLIDGVSNFFVVFIQVSRDRSGSSLFLEPNVTSGDYLQGFLLGTQQALSGKKRESLTLTISEVSPFSIGMLIALFERAVGFYASLININAYHQPGVEAGKTAAGKVLEIQSWIITYLEEKNAAFTVTQIASGIEVGDLETVFQICEHLAANPERRIRKHPGQSPFEASYQFV